MSSLQGAALKLVPRPTTPAGLAGAEPPIASAELSELLQLLYQEAMDPSPWSRTFELLRQRFNYLRARAVSVGCRLGLRILDQVVEDAWT